MHTLRLNIDDDIYDKFMGLIDILPKKSISIEEIEEIDKIPHYPSISLKEAKEKVTNSVNNISKGEGKDISKVFDEILNRK